MKVFGLCFVQTCPTSPGHCGFQSSVVLLSLVHGLGGVLMPALKGGVSVLDVTAVFAGTGCCHGCEQGEK